MTTKIHSIRVIVRDILDCACSATWSKSEELIAELEARERLLIEQERTRALTTLEARIAETARQLNERQLGPVGAFADCFSGAPI